MEENSVKELGRIVHEKNLEALKNAIKDNNKLQPQSLEGLSLNEVERNRQIFGSNILPTVRQKRFFEFLWEALQDRILILLAGSAIVSLIVHFRNNGWIEGVAILLAVIIVVMVNAINDWKKDQMFRSLNKKSREGMKSRVVRAGNSDLVPVQDLVIYDLIQLEPGNILPADAILVHQTHPLVVDESTATGESKNLTKSIDIDPFFFSGTRITDGSGLVRIVAIGENSFHGKLIMAMRGEVEQTPLQIQLNKLADFIAKIGLSLAIFLFVALIFKHLKDPELWHLLSEFLIAAITVVVVAVPEGLPMAVTLALAFATNRMLKDNNLVRVLASCETMGRVTSICSDKTGTLTENRMTVIRSDLTENSEFELNERIKLLVCEGLAVNSTAFEIENETGEFNFVGSATEAALLRFLRDSLNASYTLIRRKKGITKVIPFSSARKLMISVNEDGIVHLKGAAEIVLQKCTKIMKKNGLVCELKDEELREIKRLINEMNSEALRTIGQAYAEIHNKSGSGTNFIDDNDEVLFSLEYTWLAVYGIEDPLRPGVKEAVTTCQRAGIFVRMVTGDCRETAESIARRCGILMRGGVVLEGPEFKEMTDEQIVAKLPKLQVLARSSPFDKQRLVRLLKFSIGEVVAVTGDGSNDGPALKAADVGFSMGITGTQLAQEASAIVLLDDNFASIVKAASWGRCITRSVRKFLQFQLTVNVAAVVTAVITALTTRTSVLTAVQMLWINLMMDSMGALALATDLPTPDLLEVPPERPGNPLINRLMICQIASQSILQLILCLGIFYINPLGFSDPEMRTFIFNLFVFLQLFNELNCRSISGKWRESLVQMFDVENWMFWMIWLGTVVLQILIVETGGIVFDLVGLDILLWIYSIVLAMSSLPLATLVRILYSSFKNLESENNVSIHPSREQLAWQSAVNQVKTSAKFYSALRRRVVNLPIEGINGQTAATDNAKNSKNYDLNAHNEIYAKIDPFVSPQLSPKSTDDLLF